ncbi:MAG TPA: hypothetical protein VGD53_24995, partial [Actinoallomurus sp.]
SALHERAAITIIDTLGASEGRPFAFAITRSVADLPSRFIPAPGTSVLREDGTAIEPGGTGIGVLAFTGPIPLGYHDDPVLSERTFRTVDGVRHTSPRDLAELLPDGSIRLLGRQSGVINTEGEKVHPQERREAHRSQPAGPRSRTGATRAAPPYTLRGHGTHAGACVRWAEGVCGRGTASPSVPGCGGESGGVRCGHRRHGNPAGARSSAVTAPRTSRTSVWPDPPAWRRPRRRRPASRMRCGRRGRIADMAAPRAADVDDHPALGRDALQRGIETVRAATCE